MKNILLIEDNESILKGLVYSLEARTIQSYYCNDNKRFKKFTRIK